MSTQPEALRLACILDSYPMGSKAGTKKLAAAELRRLHEVNAELLSSLRAIAAVAETHRGAYWNTIKDCARISIAKTTGEQ